MPALLVALFGTPAPLVGMIHLAPLPGAPRWPGTPGAMEALLERAVQDARTLAAAGVDGVLVENYGDVPFFPERVPAETLAALAVAAREVVRAVNLPVGVNLLRNDGPGAVAAAVAAGARFVRINVHTGVMAADQGLLQGRAHETLRLRARLQAGEPSPVALFADVWVKHATPLPGAELAQAAEDTCRRGLADALIVSGSGTGKAASLERAAAVRRAVPECPLLLGSGVTPATAAAALRVAHGAIIGSAMAREGVAGNPVDPDRAAAMVAAWRAARAAGTGPGLTPGE